MKKACHGRSFRSITFESCLKVSFLSWKELF